MRLNQKITIEAKLNDKAWFALSNIKICTKLTNLNFWILLIFNEAITDRPPLRLLPPGDLHLRSIYCCPLFSLEINICLLCNYCLITALWKDQNSRSRTKEKWAIFRSWKILKSFALKPAAGSNLRSTRIPSGYKKIWVGIDLRQFLMASEGKPEAFYGRPCVFRGSVCSIDQWVGPAGGGVNGESCL